MCVEKRDRRLDTGSVIIQSNSCFDIFNFRFYLFPLPVQIFTLSNAKMEKRKKLHETDDEVEIIDSEPSSNKKKKCMKSASCQKFKAAYHTTWRFLEHSPKGETYAHCTICKTHFSVAHGGRTDCNRHVETKLHKENAKAASSKITGFLAQGGVTAAKSELTRQRQTTRAEVRICQLIAESNLPLAMADKFTTAFKEIFHDSDIAKNIQCGRNKATVLLNKLAENAQVDLTSRMKGPFTISTDGSNDASSKQFPIVVRSLNPETGLVSSELLSIPVCAGSATGMLKDECLNQ